MKSFKSKIPGIQTGFEIFDQNWNLFANKNVNNNFIHENPEKKLFFSKLFRKVKLIFFYIEGYCKIFEFTDDGFFLDKIIFKIFEFFEPNFDYLTILKNFKIKKTFF